jgi:hypothetical protein
MDTVEVQCYSGHTYAERPFSFTWRGREYQVVEIVQEWRDENGKCFIVWAGDNKSFKLCYNEAQDIWRLEPPEEQQDA